ncbi:MAG: hypothetical protein WBG41_15830 [Acidimicrobiales bacterium]
MALIVGMTGTALAVGATSGAGAAPASLHLRLHQAPAPASSSPSGRGGRALRALRPESSSGWHQVNEINGNPSSLLGFAIAVSGSTMVVGAGNDNSGTGAAYVYTGSRGHWTEAAELVPADGANEDGFGTSVAISGSTIVVGSYCHSATPSINCEGAAYVFTGSGSHWSPVAELDDPGASADDYFGWDVAATSASTILVSGIGENSNAGAVYAYAFNDGTWSEDAEIMDPTNTANDNFGIDLAFSGATLVVGAAGYNSYAGAAYVFAKVRTAWVEQARLTASNGEGCVSTCSQGYDLAGGDYFGSSVAVHKHTIAVGAPEASVPPAPDGVGPGTAYVFTGSGATWTQKSELYDPEEVAADNGDSFGYEVAVSTTGTVVCNAPGDPQGYESDDSIGAAFVFASDRGTWPTSSPTELTAADGADGDYFGYGLATLKGNYIIVGSPFSPDGGVYFFKS